MAKQAEATSLRAAEKAENAKVLADAMQALREFYGSADSGASLLQGKSRGAQISAQAAREPYSGMGDATGGVMGLLDVILSDFARLETETSSAEDQAAAAYDKYMAESAEDKAVKETELGHNEGRKQDFEEMLRTDKKELKLTQEELDKALDYYDKLKSDCLDTGLSYEDRVRMRQEEIQSLKEALQILNGEELA